MPIKYYPEDDTGFVGIKFPMNGRGRNTSDGFFNMSRTTEEQAVSNYINLLLTRPGERYMQPDFGIGIQKYLFEQNTGGNRKLIEAEIRRQAAFWLPYIFNKNIEVTTGKDLPGLAADPENAIHIVITFSVTEFGANQTIILFEQGGRTNFRLE